jgi:membrane protein DedA with SNARE-associated domain
MALSVDTGAIMHAELPAFLSGLAPALSRYGYLALFGMVGIESFGIPAPGQSILIAASICCASGQLNPALVAAVAFVAATTCDNAGFAIGRFGGRRLIGRHGQYLFLTESRIERVAAVLSRRGAPLLVLARFLDGLRQLNGVVAGLTGMSWRTFAACNALGAALWVALWTSVGHFAGGHLNDVLAGLRQAF